MDRHSYGTDRWKIVYGRFEGIEANAVKMLYAGVSREVPYVLTAESSDDCSSDVSLLVVGTRQSNSLLRELTCSEEIPEDGFLVRIMDSPFQPERQVALLAGSTERETLYAVSHYLNTYLPYARQNGVHTPYFLKLFSGKMKPYRFTAKPDFAERGIWTWGHCIYDHRHFAENMARLGLNAITIWNDYAPVNLKEVTSCFHSFGIKVYFGYSWGWDEEIAIGSEQALEYWKEKALSVFEKEYADAGGDGIYFQSFTETDAEEIDGVSIAEAVTKWVNSVSDAMLQCWPGLDIRFGLHATSVKNQMQAIAGVDSRVSIHWEDCGAFPYAYLSRDTDGSTEMLRFTDAMASLRPGGRYGAVLKGQVCLDWSMFENQKGPFILGCDSREKIAARLPAVRQQWHDVQRYWLKNLGQFRKTLKHLAGADVYALVEDGLLEEACWYPTVLYSLSLWHGEWLDGELLEYAAGRADTVFA